MKKLVQYKACTNCGEEKENSGQYFYKRTTGKLHAECKVCFNKRTSENSKAPHRKLYSKIYNKKYRTDNKEKTLERQKISRHKKIDYYRNKERERRKNPETKQKRIEANRKWYIKNPNYKSSNRAKHLKKFWEKEKESDRYIKSLLLRSHRIEKPTKDIIELKKIHIILKRNKNERKNEQSTNP